MFGLEALLLQQDMVTRLQLGAPHLLVILSFMMFGLLLLCFLDPDYKANADCSPANLHNHGDLDGAVPLFAIQTVGQGLVSAFAQTSDSMG